MQLLTPQFWQTYQLIDSGGFEKLERFGDYLLARPEPQAVWDKSLAEVEWERRANAFFRKEKNNPEKGQWERKKGMPEHWRMPYRHAGLDLTFNLSLSSFKHVGIFPEQAVNWEYIHEKVKLLKEKVAQPKVLNLFAYTGGASLAVLTYPTSIR
jgi:23S rRNA (cytosine1962-C5)-methyltransferase